MLYDYICKDCQKPFELVFTLGEHDKDNLTCPKCESKNVEQDAATFSAVTFEEELKHFAEPIRTGLGAAIR